MKTPSVRSVAEWKAFFTRHKRRLRAVAFFMVGWAVAMTLNNRRAAEYWNQMPPAPPPVVDRADDQRVSRVSFDQYQVIMDRNLFDVSVDRTEPPPPPEPETKPVEVVEDKPLDKSPLPAEVIGTLAGPDRYSAALIMDKRSKKTELYFVGDNLFGQATILKINRRQVVVLRGNKQEMLEIAEDAAASNKGGGRKGRDREEGRTTVEDIIETKSDDTELVVDEVGEGDFVIDKESFESVLSDMGSLLTQARVVPNFKQGKISGYKIFAIKSGSVFEQIGLKNGDVIHSVNEVDVDTPEKALQLFQQLKAETNFALDIERNGSTQSFSYRLQ